VTGLKKVSWSIAPDRAGDTGAAYGFNQFNLMRSFQFAANAADVESTTLEVMVLS